MKGNNSMSLNQATVIEMLQHYLDTILFSKGQSPRITSFIYYPSDNLLRLQLKEQEPSEKKGP